MIDFLFDSTVKVSIVLLIALTATRLLHRRSAALRHWVLAAAVVCAAVLPALERVAPSWHMPPGTLTSLLSFHPAASGAHSLTGAAEPAVTATSMADAEVSTAQARDLGLLLGALWGAGFIWSMSILAIGWRRLAWLASRSGSIRRGPWADALEDARQASGITRPITLLSSQHPHLLVTWGLVRPKVLLPTGADEWPADRMHVVMRHEIAHIFRNDWAVQMLAEILRCAHWFNPLLWLVCRRLRQESEHACDDAVLNSGVVDAPLYASHVLELARRSSDSRRLSIPAPAIVRHSSLERRIRAMLDARVHRQPVTRPMRAAIAIGVLGIALPVAGYAQATFASFSGSVLDPMHGVLPATTLVLTNEQSRAKHEVQTDRTGRFEFVGLPPGRYQLQAQLPGFAILHGTVVMVGQDVEQDLTLKLGSLEETVTVARRSPGSASEPSPTPGRQAGPAHIECGDPPSRADRPIGGNIKVPRPTARVNPVYPPIDVAGLVVLDGCIGLDGFIRDIQVVSAPHPDLSTAALGAIHEWQWTETLLNGVAVEVPIRVRVHFTLTP